ncbi:peptide transporter PTR2A [Guyanagaster necrorhizus]|uniref:Peptide transporter PTR2A n=1 Tax=Guyanagaster necrorhizus TaxID=856835 RepID=A0A9P7VLU5_9AGAR|nr:peptide transporter PTR2A [Guyanagaster necrorhizus MCA 3950]KAG7443566.1 peptide transporter PTR2A [Guyanagaster necrorhizus MCA 3950]
MAGIQVEADLAALSYVKQQEDEKSTSEHDHELDGVHDGLDFPTEEERATLRRISDTIPWNAYLIAVVELAERFSYYGCQVVFTNFIQQPLPEGSHTGAGFTHGQSGALGRGQRASTGLNTFYQFWVYVTPLFGAYIADTYWGRYNTVCFSVFVALVGHIILIVSAVPGVIEKESAMGAFSVALIVMGIGTGFFKSNISPLVAEQYRRKKLFVITTKRGERVIVDPVYTVSRIYMYFYLFINIGALIGQVAMTYAEKYVGFWLAFTLPTVVFLLCPLVLWFGRNRYVRSPPTGSVLGTTMKLWLYAAKGRWSINPIKTYKNMTAPDFWENVKPSRQDPGKKPAWMNFDDQWVDQVRRGFKACSVFLWYPIYWLTYNQLNSNLTSQAATMTTNGIPNDVLSNLDPFALIIFIPICDILIYPALRRGRVNFSALKKICAGFATGNLGAAAMIWSAVDEVVQHYIYKTNPCGYSAATCETRDGSPLLSPLNVWIQTGSYVLIAFSEILASITGLEYAFTKAPTNMRSLVMSVYTFTNAFAAAIAEAFVSLSADPLLVWNYGVMATIAGIAGIFFWFAVRKLDAEEDKLNNIQEGHVEPSKPEA